MIFAFCWVLKPSSLHYLYNNFNCKFNNTSSSYHKVNFVYYVEIGLFVVIILYKIFVKKNSCPHFVWIKTWGPYNDLLDCFTSVILHINTVSLEIYKALPHLPHYGISWSSFCVYHWWFQMKDALTHKAPSNAKLLERKQIWIWYELFLNMCWLHVSVLTLNTSRDVLWENTVHLQYSIVTIPYDTLQRLWSCFFVL
jgi:hypothetical protein